jgi:hypothetical protein
MHQNQVKLRGILYLHPITDNRMRGSARRNLFMFKKLCGKEAEKNVVLATTMWEKMVDQNEAQRRDDQLRKEYWGEMIDNGSTTVRHYNNQESAITIVEKILCLNDGVPTVLAIQQEMAEGKQLVDTGAGQELNRALLELKEQSRREREQFEHDMLEARQEQDRAAQEQIRLLIEERDKKIKQLQEAQELMRVNMEEMHNKKYGELEKKMKAQEQVVQKAQDEVAGLIKKHKSKLFFRRGAKVDDNINISLCGDRYYFCGVKKDSYQVPPDLARDLKIHDGQQYFVCLGPNGAFIRKFVGTVSTRTTNENVQTHVTKYAKGSDGGLGSKGRGISWSLGKYPALDGDEGIPEFGKLGFASLGPSDFFFYRTEDYSKRFGALPASLQKIPTDHDKVWFGYGGSWVAYDWRIVHTDRWWWDLKGHYQELEKILSGTYGKTFDKKLIKVRYTHFLAPSLSPPPFTTPL